jgi:hypothetical protein
MMNTPPHPPRAGDPGFLPESLEKTATGMLRVRAMHGQAPDGQLQT